MTAMNINDFMARFHVLEEELALFDDHFGGDLWWHSIRFEICYFIYDCLTGLNLTAALRPNGRSRAIGRARRALERLKLFTDARLRHRDMMIVRAARSVDDRHVRHDVVLDPIINLIPAKPLIIDTVPRRFHLPDVGHLRPARLAPRVVEILDLLLCAFRIEDQHDRLCDLTASVRAEYLSQLAGYDRLFAAARPRAVLMVQNGVARALFTAAQERGIPTAEAQHGLIGFGHPGYSYPRSIRHDCQPGFPDLFLTFSAFWSERTYYPAARHGIIGTDHFAQAMPPAPLGLNTVLVVGASIYHDALMALTRELARRLPTRRFIYKLHPGQSANEPAIRAALADIPNVQVGSAGVPIAALMDDVTHLIAIQSTAVYEALQAGRRIIIVPQHNYHLHADIFDRPEVSVLKTPAAMADALAVPVSEMPRPVFFEPFAPEKARALIETLLLAPA